jgi:transcription-repair coupling factor (superfamily II helicase)
MSSGSRPGPRVQSFPSATIHLRNPDRLVAHIREQGPQARVRPDMKVVFFHDWPTPEKRLKGTTAILRSLANLTKPAKAA